MMTKPISWYAERYITRFGLAIVPIDPGQKFPSAQDWGNKVITTPAAAIEFYTANPDWNMGMVLGPSRTCSLDIDCLESFATILEEFGIPLADLDKYPTIQGRDKGKRVTFSVPDGVDLPYIKLNWPRQDDPAKLYTVFELRAATDGRQRQDVLPPSIHPETGKPYRWLVQPTDEWPEPPGWLLAIWQAWDSFRPQLVAACPWSPKEEIKPQKRRSATSTGSPTGGTDVIHEYCSRHDIRSTLEQYGYVRKGKRYLSPHSGTGLPGVVILPDERAAWIHHASDPLCSESSGQPVDPFDLYSYYEHGGDVSKAVKAAAEAMGIKQQRKPRTPPAVPAPQTDDHSPSAIFQPLGYSGDHYYYLPQGTEQVQCLRRAGHTSPAELLGLAPIEWWEVTYPKEKGGTDWHLAASDLMRKCERRGIYSPDLERGRGAWYDEGRSVLHLGGRLVVDGRSVAISDHKSRYIYTRQSSLEHGADATPATDALAAEVADLFRQVNWQKPVHAQLLAGWCFLAPICGALPWRPHVWLTAQRGAGKSWILDHIIGPLLGPAALMVQGSTTEAGIRQRLRQDSRPIVFDEAESEDNRSQHRIQTVIELARQSSSDSSAEIVKGTVGGVAMSFRMRSMFLLGSINVALSQAADESRFSVLSIKSANKSPAEFEAFANHVAGLLTPDNCASIRARAYTLIGVIRANAKTFARAVAEVLGSQRTGDQVGALLAGAYTLATGAEATYHDACEWVSGLDFSDSETARQVSDEERCLQTLLQAQVRIDTDRGSVARTIGELVDIASGREYSLGMTISDACTALTRQGIKVESEWLIISNTHSSIKGILSETPWGGGWSRILERIPGAEPLGNPTRFAGTKTRAVRVPLGFSA